MCENDSIESLIKLAEVSWRDYSERRSIEWKVNFGVWVALGTFGGFIFQKNVTLPLWIVIAITLLLVGIFLVYTFLWKMEVQQRNQNDKERTRYYLGKVNTALSLEPPKDQQDEPQWLKQIGWRRTHLAQVVVTFLFVLVAALAVWVPQFPETS
jgi:Ca2+/Na+ antiporter